MRLTDCSRGDLVAIVWPEGSDQGSRGPFSDSTLRGREVLVQYGGPAHATDEKKRKGKERQYSAAYVTVCDWETMRPERDGFRCISNVEVIDVVESKHRKVDEETERALGREGDAADPLAR